MSHKVRVWDLPTRLFHWSLVLCVTGLFATAYVPGAWIEWHARLGYAALALVLFRIVWGFVGGHWSRFSSFVRGPSSVLAYLRGQPHPDHLIGHNPLGALSVLAILAVLLVQVGTGLVSDDEIAFTGPLNRFVESAQGLAATWFHRQVGQWALIALVVAHIAAIAYYVRVKKTNLVAPMVHGDKPVAPAQARSLPSSRDDLATRVRALTVLAVSAGLVYALVRLGG